MSMFLRRAIGKIKRECSRLILMTRILNHPSVLPDNSEAISLLNSISPDPGGSCWTNDGFEYDERSLLLSVIVPAYNAEKYIINCMKSILSQQVSFDYEVIVVNDGSTDATPVLLEQYEIYERVRILNQENRGASAARNHGIAFSRGEYICFVDADDELTDGALESLGSEILEVHSNLVVGSIEKRLRNGILQYTTQFKHGKATINSLPGYSVGKIIHHSVFQNLRFPEGYWYEDSIMAQIVHPMCWDTAYAISHICYTYYSNEHGMTAISKGNKKSIDSLWITMRLLQERKLFGLEYTQESYVYFLSMVNLTYHRTKNLGAKVAQCVFVLQKMLLEKYYPGEQAPLDHKRQRIREALQSGDFKKYVWACERK